MAADAKPVEIVGTWSQTRQLDMHAVRQFCCCRGDPALHDAGEPLVGGDFPFDLDAKTLRGAVGQASAEGVGASRVQITAPSSVGSPDPTPSVNGSARTGLRRRLVVNPATGSTASTMAPLSTVRRLGDTDTAECRQVVFRDGDGEKYGVPPQR